MKVDDASNAAVATLNQMKARLAAHPARRLVAGDEKRIAPAEQPDGFRRDARQVDHNFERLVGLEHVNRRRALARQRLVAEGPSQLEIGRASCRERVRSAGVPWAL